MSEEPLRCAVCGNLQPDISMRTAEVHSNVRAFRAERFRLWQCAACGSIHARDEVDLDHYYAQYPFHGQTMNVPTRLSFASKLRHLETLGLRRDQRVLDYGCGSGLFVQYLRQRGFTRARGYDAYAKDGAYTVLPSKPQDAILAQDVIEHVADPAEFLRTLRKLSVPRGLLVIGTPDAAVVDLSAPEPYVNLLHQPYHRHILSCDALVALAERLHFTVLDVHHGFFGSALLPGLNSLYLSRVLRASGNILDDTLAGKVPFSWELFTPPALWDALTGGMRDPGFDMTVALRVPN